ncbi:MAG: hypothetical protein OHK0052_26570 [Anaerolineales bacterium]
MSRDTAIILVLATALLCGCPGLVMCFTGTITSFAGVSELQASNDPAALIVGFTMLCMGIFGIIIPLAIGLFTLLPRKAAVDTLPQEPIPPAI